MAGGGAASELSAKSASIIFAESCAFAAAAAERGDVAGRFSPTKKDPFSRLRSNSPACVLLVDAAAFVLFRGAKRLNVATISGATTCWRQGGVEASMASSSSTVVVAAAEENDAAPAVVAAGRGAAAAAASAASTIASTLAIADDVAAATCSSLGRVSAALSAAVTWDAAFPRCCVAEGARRLKGAAAKPAAELMEPPTCRSDPHGERSPKTSRHNVGSRGGWGVCPRLSWSRAVAVVVIFGVSLRPAGTLRSHSCCNSADADGRVAAST